MCSSTSSTRAAAERHYPEEQGLKPEPAYLDRPLVVAERHYPEEQGLKPHAPYQILDVAYSREALSRRTRIETLVFISTPIIYMGAERHYPEEQGLKLDQEFGGGART